MRKLVMSLLGATALVAASGASAQTFNFGSPANTDLGPTHVYTAGTYSITASGYSAPGAATDLYAKDLGDDEIGVGLTIDPAHQNEIPGPGTAFVQLDVTSLLSMINGLDVTFGSTTLGEEWGIYGSNVSGDGGTFLSSGSTEGTPSTTSLSGWGNYHFYDFYSLGTNGQTTGNILLSSATVAGVPEPATWAMMLLGFGAIGVAARRRRKTVLAQLA
jgi:hypothetical protein